MGDDGAGSLLRLSSVYWPGLESSEGLNGAGGPAARLCHMRAWRVSACWQEASFLPCGPSSWDCLNIFTAWQSPFLRTWFKRQVRDFPGGAVVRNPPASAGDTGSIPGPGRSHMPPSN